MKGVKKEFFWQDKTGRGYTNTFTLRELQDAFRGQKNWDGQAASSWADFAEVGDEWENKSDKIVRTK